MIGEQERREQIDLPFYHKEIAPILPPEVLDFHVHIWEKEGWKAKPGENDALGSKYMVVQV